MPRIVRGAGHALLRDAEAVAALLAIGRDTGRTVTDHRTSWVREVPSGSDRLFVKVYEYPTWPSRWRGLGRRVAPWSRSRAAAEFDALTWLREQGLAGAEPILAAEQRCLGFLVRGVLVSADFGGPPVDQWFERLDRAAQGALAAAVGRFVGRMHRLGFRDRNLDLRNLLARRDADGDWLVAKIDSPRHCLRRPGRTDRLVRADWDRLLPQLAPYGLAAIANAAADDAAP